MFDMLPDVWTPLVPVARIDANPMALELAGEQIVVFRDGDGVFHALMDRCPHRGVPLSLGDVTEEGSLRCAYHGWRFRGDGSCARIPLNSPDLKVPGKVGVPSLPVRIVAGALWVHTGPGPAAEPVLPPSLTSPERPLVFEQHEWAAHWTPMLENQLDFGHICYAHRGTFGAGPHAMAEAGARSGFKLTETQYGFDLLSDLDGGPPFLSQWWRPNIVVLFGEYGPGSITHFCSVPLGPRRSRLLIMRSIPEAAAGDGPAFPIKPIEEDRRIIESIPADVTEAGHQQHVPSDAPMLVFRRWYRQAIGQARAPEMAPDAR